MEFFIGSMPEIRLILLKAFHLFSVELNHIRKKFIINFTQNITFHHFANISGVLCSAVLQGVNLAANCLHVGEGSSDFGLAVFLELFEGNVASVEV